MSENQDAHVIATASSPSADAVRNLPVASTPSDCRDPSIPSLLTPPSMQHVENQELDDFILELLKKPQERIFLLKLENDLEAFINNYQMYRLDLPQMNSYQRLMVHKVAPYFKLSHFYDPIRKSVYLCKNQFTELPAARFQDLVKLEEEESSEEMPKFKIMRRAPLSQNQRQNSDGSKGPNSGKDRKNMTYEERRVAYEEARARIFQGSEQPKEDGSRENPL